MTCPDCSIAAIAESARNLGSMGNKGERCTSPKYTAQHHDLRSRFTNLARSLLHFSDIDMTGELDRDVLFKKLRSRPENKVRVRTCLCLIALFERASLNQAAVTRHALVSFRIGA